MKVSSNYLYPIILTYRNHNNRNRKLVTHTLYLPKYILPSEHADQLTYAVIQCRIVKLVKTTKYSMQF